MTSCIQHCSPFNQRSTNVQPISNRFTVSTLPPFAVLRWVSAIFSCGQGLVLYVRTSSPAAMSFGRPTQLGCCITSFSSISSPHRRPITCTPRIIVLILPVIYIPVCIIHLLPTLLSNRRKRIPLVSVLLLSLSIRFCLSLSTLGLSVHTCYWHSFHTASFHLYLLQFSLRIL
ncbi:hypothetical protein BDN72DRAFT_163712 [Pluteus cervinus]|uniref:Uncharacterized protein n=1 Tax=Pluteus cervinus TaxID=181527 RepID=A0ACD3AK53_9AGAR|nr:hypothetical protein BDN72DRAFT_163712 [Pluteus cervinus]